MKKAFLVVFIFCAFTRFYPSARSGEPSDTLSQAKPGFEESLTDALRCIKMTPDDLRFRDDYVDVDSFRLELIDSLMREPLQTASFNAQVLSDLLAFEPEYRRLFLPFRLSRHLKMRGKPGSEWHREIILGVDEFVGGAAGAFKKLHPRLNGAVNSLVMAKRTADERTREAVSGLTDEELDFVKANFPRVLLEDVNDEFKTPEELDKEADLEEELAKEMVPYLAKIDLREILWAGDDLFPVAELHIRSLKEYLETEPELKSQVKNEQDRLNDLIFRGETSSGEIVVIGGSGSSRYTGSPSIIIDLGGDDEYNISAQQDKQGGSSVIIDLGGNDLYKAEGDFAYGSGFLGTGVLVDLSGDDTYLAKNFSLGSGVFGVGVLVDEEGDDKYFGDTFGQGAGSFGMGILADMTGADQYSGALFVQGFGFVSGMGALIDSSGNDNYFAGGRYKDILRYKDHYISLSQGFAYGLRPMMSGGIGMLFDLSGNDVYTSDIFGQGSSYWFSLGTLFDKEGNDKYVSFQYAQGAGTHLCLATLEDGSGDDVYISHGVSQGCGHDLALGFLRDKSGNDNYVSESLSQGAGSANGFGILADESGNDGYYIQVKANTQGYGNPRRDYGSVGILLELSGRDGYDGNGADSTWWTTPSKWGVGIDR
ncbi:MAG: hypothetical protein JSV10_09040 [Candidatus Zixiibacteriota bacterium]|nr:MAG: hypothetical protein JSV10_09040 [candidate division Zixibacteria bacterium]